MKKFLRSEKLSWEDLDEAITVVTLKFTADGEHGMEDDAQAQCSKIPDLFAMGGGRNIVVHARQVSTQKTIDQGFMIDSRSYPAAAKFWCRHFARVKSSG